MYKVPIFPFLSQKHIIFLIIFVYCPSTSMTDQLILPNLPNLSLALIPRHPRHWLLYHSLSVLTPSSLHQTHKSVSPSLPPPHHPISPKNQAVQSSISFKARAPPNQQHKASSPLLPHLHMMTPFIAKIPQTSEPTTPHLYHTNPHTTSTPCAASSSHLHPPSTPTSSSHPLPTNPHNTYPLPITSSQKKKPKHKFEN